MTYEELEECGFSYQQINQIIKAEQMGLDLSGLKVNTPVSTMRKIIEMNPDIDNKRLKLLANCLTRNLDPKYVLDESYTYNQAAQLVDGMYKKVNYELYAHPDISKNEMKLIKNSLIKGIDEKILKYAKTYPKHIKKIIEMAETSKKIKFDILKYLDDGFKQDQIQVILRAYQEGINIDKYIAPQLNSDQLLATFQCLKESKTKNIDIDITDIIKPENSKSAILTLYKLKVANLESEIKIPVLFDEYNVHQLNVIRLGITQGLDYQLYMSPEFSADKMNIILNGLQCGLDAKLYANPKFTYGQMHAIFDVLKYNRDNPEKAIEVELLCHPEYEYEKITKYAKLLKTGTLDDKLKIMKEHNTFIEKEGKQITLSR